MIETIDEKFVKSVLYKILKELERLGNAGELSRNLDSVITNIERSLETIDLHSNNDIIISMEHELKDNKEGGVNEFETIDLVELYWEDSDGRFEIDPKSINTLVVW